MSLRQAAFGVFALAMVGYGAVWLTMPDAKFRSETLTVVFQVAPHEAWGVGWVVAGLICLLGFVTLDRWPFALPLMTMFIAYSVALWAALLEGHAEVPTAPILPSAIAAVLCLGVAWPERR